MAGLMLNEDNSHFFSSREPEDLTVAGLERLVDHYAGPQVRDLLFCPNAMRTSYASAVWEPICKGYDPGAGKDQPFFRGRAAAAGVEVARRWVDHALRLHRAGIDPYAIWLEAARARGKGAWLSMRMNDLHDVDDPDSFMHADLWRQRPDLRRVTHRPMRSWPDAAFDYGQAEVRQHHLRLVAELLERYDPDGLELDWMRFGFHFRPGHEAAGRQVLTDFTARVRELTEAAAARRGHPVRVGARVPSRPRAARGLGMDAVAWARQGLVDRLVVTPFWATVEPDMPVALWQELLAGTGVEVAAGLELLLRPFPEAEAVYNTAASVRGAAASLLHRGADAIYLFNYMDSHTTMRDPADLPAILAQAGELETACAHPRRHVVTYSDTQPPGLPTPTALPAICSGQRLAAFRIPIGPRPTGGRARVVLGLDGEGSTAAGASAPGPDLEVWVNGEPGRPAASPALPLSPTAVNTAAFDVSPAALGDGDNVVEVLSRGAAEHRLVWVEVYLEP